MSHNKALPWSTCCWVSSVGEGLSGARSWRHGRVGCAVRGRGHPCAPSLATILNNLGSSLTQHRFQPQNPLSGAPQFVAKDPQDDDDLKLCSHTMMLPTRGQLEGRMIVTAYEHGLDNVTDEAVSAVVYAVEVGLPGAASRAAGTGLCAWSEVAAAGTDPTCRSDV